MPKKDTTKSEKSLSEQIQDIIKDMERRNLGDLKTGVNTQNHCPNCGYCPTCGRQTRPNFYPSIPFVGDFPNGTFIGSAGTTNTGNVNCSCGRPNCDYDAAAHSAWY